MKAARRLQRLQNPHSLMGMIREFLTPEVWKQARQAVPRKRKVPRWDLQPLVFVMLAMCWSGGDCQGEQFETARSFVAAARSCRRRPGKTVQGFQKALARVSTRQLRVLCEGVRQQIRRKYGQRLLIDGFEPFGIDGSRLECPRSKELEARLGQAGKADSAPTVWVTACVHLGTGLLWSWRLGKGTADERQHLRQLLSTLSRQTLLVTDAAYMGYELVQDIRQAGISCLLRLSSRTHLYTREKQSLEAWEQGPVYYWPEHHRKDGLPPVPGRLIRIRNPKAEKADVWLFTDVLDPERLSIPLAAKFYRWRWRNEGLFRTYKRTLGKLKLSSRTVALVHREAELSLLGLQLLLAHADLALRPQNSLGQPAVSPRKVLREIRIEIAHSMTWGIPSYAHRLKRCAVKTRTQQSSRVRRAWPRRKPHKPPAAPTLRSLVDEPKTLQQLELHAV